MAEQVFSDKSKELIENSDHIKKELNETMNTPGWGRIVSVLQDSINVFQDQLKNTEFDNLRQVDRLQFKIAALEKLMGLPELLITIAETSEEMPSLDPFETMSDSLQNDQ